MWPFHKHRWVVENYDLGTYERFWMSGSMEFAYGYQPSVMRVCACGEREWQRFTRRERPPATEGSAMAWVKSQGDFDPANQALRSAIKEIKETKK